MRFVDYKLEKVSANNMDTSLISPTLQLELYVNQRADFLIQIPIFALAQECYPETWLQDTARHNVIPYTRHPLWISVMRVATTTILIYTLLGPKFLQQHRVHMVLYIIVCRSWPPAEKCAWHILELSKEIFGAICAAFTKNFYEKGLKYVEV